MRAPDRSPEKKILHSASVWTITTYFAEGFPFTIIRQVSALFFRDLGASLESIGLTSLYAIPWIFKFLWGPLVDRFGTKRNWLLSMETCITITLFCAAFAVPLPGNMTIIALVLFACALLAATHDIAVDGYYMAALDTDGQAKFLGYRVMAYRIAMIAGTGAIATIGTRISWFAAFFSGASLFCALYLYHLLFLPRPESGSVPLTGIFSLFKNRSSLAGAAAIVLSISVIHFIYRSPFYRRLEHAAPFLTRMTFSLWVALLLFTALVAVFLFRAHIRRAIMNNPDSFYTRAFLSFIDRKNTGVIFAAIILLRAGEYMLSMMVAPFFVDLGIKTHYGWISSAVGIPLSIAGAIAGGWAISRFGLKKVIWPFLFLQNFTNIFYMILAFSLKPVLLANTGTAAHGTVGLLPLVSVCIVHGFDQFSGGLGTAVLMTFLMRICLPQFKAAHYAIGTGFMNISQVFVGVCGGFICSWLGYGWFFGISFIVSIPGMIAVLFLPGDILRSEQAINPNR